MNFYRSTLFILFHTKYISFSYTTYIKEKFIYIYVYIIVKMIHLCINVILSLDTYVQYYIQN